MRYQCERCGGIGKQPAGCWDGTAYASPSGCCDDCRGVGILGFREVAQVEFFAAVGPLDCNPVIAGEFPYTSQFTTPRREVVGAIVDDEAGGKRFYLPAD